MISSNLSSIPCWLGDRKGIWPVKVSTTYPLRLSSKKVEEKLTETGQPRFTYKADKLKVMVVVFFFA